MRVVDIIAKKRDGIELSSAEIDFIVSGYARDEIPDYQAAAWSMAVLLNGMSDAETTALTLSMASSGEQIDLSDVVPLVADKHSTGGVGDKVTLVLGPVVAAAGQPVGKMSGRGLGFSGGTLDKLESIPGWSPDLSIKAFKEQLATIGLVVAGQTADLAPADKKLYALRDVTATVPSMPLIASSVMSKKIAAGANVILLDVKVGDGAFMKTLDEATILAQIMVAIGTGAGRTVTARLTDMDQPLGCAVGNALEVKEAIATLKMDGPTDFTELIVGEAALLLLMCGRAMDVAEGELIARQVMNNGSALAKFQEFVAAQGGDPAVVERPDALLADAPTQYILPSPYAGYLSAVRARAFGMAAVQLGGGRARKDDVIDASVGIVLHAKVGDYVDHGQPLCTIHARSREQAISVQDQLLAAYHWSETPVEKPALVKRSVGPFG